MRKKVRLLEKPLKPHLLAGEPAEAPSGSYFASCCSVSSRGSSTSFTDWNPQKSGMFVGNRLARAAAHTNETSVKLQRQPARLCGSFAMRGEYRSYNVTTDNLPVKRRIIPPPRWPVPPHCSGWHQWPRPLWQVPQQGKRKKEIGRYRDKLNIRSMTLDTIAQVKNSPSIRSRGDRG